MTILPNLTTHLVNLNDESDRIIHFQCFLEVLANAFRPKKPKNTHTHTRMQHWWWGVINWSKAAKRDGMMEAEIGVMYFEDGKRSHKLRNAGDLAEAGKDKEMDSPEEM